MECDACQAGPWPWPCIVLCECTSHTILQSIPPQNRTINPRIRFAKLHFVSLLSVYIVTPSPPPKMRNAVSGLVALSLMALLAFWLIFDPLHADWAVPAFHFSVTHTVLFQFKKDADPQAIRDVRMIVLVLWYSGVQLCHFNMTTRQNDGTLTLDLWDKACNGMMALRTACVNPSSLQPYIKSLTGGKDNSLEGLQVSLPATASGL